MAMKRLDLEVVGSLFWIMVGVVFALGALRMRLGTFRNPGPGFIPLGIALLLFSLSLGNLIKGLIHRIRHSSVIPWKKPAFVVASVLLYMWLLGLIGFLPSTFMLMLVLIGLLISVQKNRWPKVFFSAAVAALSAWLIFSFFLRVPLP